MRFNLVLERVGKRSFLPFNYQYEFSSWIYKVIEGADASFSAFLHGTAYQTGSKRFKLFTFSNPDLRPYKVHKEVQRIEICGTHISMQISFLADRAAENFIKGLFLNQQFSIGDKFSSVDFIVSRIEAVAPPVFQESMRYKTISPVCVSVKGEKHPQYISPEHPEYEQMLLNNLVNKLKVMPVEVPELQISADDAEFKFALLSEVRKKLITIKSFTPNQSQIRGFEFRFELIAPPLLQEVAYYAGVGEKGAIGFGCVEIV
ncbi:CRISPR-associated endoribonuclease Cas6 [Cytophagaceae bacterium ABcell3]|nr:CRISPR-associated endoribonuclease Cas6 [Cytophagaceae bacterium ABcell3]